MKTTGGLGRNLVTRRAVLGAAAASTMIAASGAALAQQPAPAKAPRVKGPRVWLDRVEGDVVALIELLLFQYVWEGT